MRTSSTSTIGRWLAGSLLTCLLAATWRKLTHVHHARVASTPRAKPERLQVWEDEGGQNQMPEQPR